MKQEDIKILTFRKELISLINRHSLENGSNTPDFILADYLMDCLKVFNITTNLRGKWYKEQVTDETIHLDETQPPGARGE